MASKKGKKKHAISPCRHEDYPKWYQSIVQEADLAEMAHVRGCMVIKPWGYGIWELIQRQLDDRFKETGHENAYFPIFIPMSYIQKEAQHVQGFAKEMAVVTHHRVEERDGQLVPAAKLEEPLILRPTSETIIGESYARWIQSYRDLPMLLNQWSNTIRWEMRPRVFLRTTEFLWQEGHTAHATEKEAIEETRTMLEVYRTFAQDVMAIPVIAGEKPESERFPGAVNTFCIEAMMQDGKALQAGTSHYLGQNFAKAANIKFLDRQGKEEFVYTTSWGVSTRLIGGLIMTHSDDDGLRLPPRVAPKQVVINPILRKDGNTEKVLEYCRLLADEIGAVDCFAKKIAVHLDIRDIRSVDKKWQWIKKGVPVILEIGGRDLESGNVCTIRRDRIDSKPAIEAKDEFVKRLPGILGEIQENYFQQAKKYLEERTNRDIENFDQFCEWFRGEGGFVIAKWSEDPKTEEKLAKLKVTVRALPFKQSKTIGKCVISGKKARTDAIFAKSY